MGWVARVHDAMNMENFHDLPAESLKEANELVRLHSRRGVIVKVVQTDGAQRETEQIVEPREKPDFAKSRPEFAEKPREIDAPRPAKPRARRTEPARKEEETTAMANPFVVKQEDVDRRTKAARVEKLQHENTKQCATPGCSGRFQPDRARRLCDACRESKASAPPAKAKPRTEPKKRATPPPSRTGAQRKSASPYDSALQELRAQREEHSAVVAKLDELIDGLEKLAGAA